MELKMRLDNTGRPYLIITHIDNRSEDSTAQDDAERLFFHQLSQNGATLHVMSNTKEHETKLLVVSSSERRDLTGLENDHFQLGTAPNTKKQPIKAQEENTFREES